jgi:hypothetical protein
MARISMTAAAALIPVFLSSASAAARVAVPPALLGEWHSADRPHACGEFDNGSIRLTKTRFETFESAGVIRAVRRVSAHIFDLSMRMTHNGGSFGYAGRFILSADQKALTVVDSPGGGNSMPISYNYARCTP